MATLYVVPTPIGNLEDITIRAVRTLREVQLILAEDTRHTKKLLDHYDISTRLLSYHQHNKRSRLDAILARLECEDIALVSSAGMPSISDPGFELIEQVAARGMRVEVLPGANAVVTAVVAAALPAPGFLFVGFLPRKSGDRRQRLRAVGRLPYSLVFYEAPHRLLDTLEDVLAVVGDRAAVAARELTKVHEEIVRSTVRGLLDRYRQEEPRGEFTLVLGAASEDVADQSSEILNFVRQRRLAGQTARDAIDEVMARFGLSRNDAYRTWVESGKTLPPTADSDI